MTIELILCVALMLIISPVSKSVSAHYGIFAGANFAMLGVQEVDSSLLVVMFTILAIADSCLVLAGGRIVLLVSAAASFALALESTINQDWLLSHVSFISIAVNALIVACMAKEYWVWMNGKSVRL